MGASGDGLHHAETAGGRSPDNRLVVQAICQPETGTYSSIPSIDQGSRVLSTLTETSKTQSAQPSVRARVGFVRGEVAPLVLLFDWRQGELIPHTQIQGQLGCDLPVILKIHGMATPLLAHKAVVFRSTRVGLTQQEGRKAITTTSSQGIVPWNAGAAAVTQDQPRHGLASEPVVMDPFIEVTHLEVVLTLDNRQVVAPGKDKVL